MRGGGTTRGEDGGQDGGEKRRGRWQQSRGCHRIPFCASVPGMSPRRQEKEEERTMEWEDEAGKMLGVQTCATRGLEENMQVSLIFVMIVSFMLLTVFPMLMYFISKNF